MVITEEGDSAQGIRIRQNGVQTQCSQGASSGLGWGTGTRVLWMVTPDIKCLEASTMEFKLCLEGIKVDDHGLKASQ